MKQNISELIEIARPVFDSIKRAVSERNEGEFRRLLDTEQPDEWINVLESEFRDKDNNIMYYQINTIALLDAIVKEVFSIVSTRLMQPPTFINEKGKVAVTTIVICEFINPPVCAITKDGFATAYASSLAHLQLATPNSFTQARKHAIRQIGTFFGRDLNRDIELDKERMQDNIEEKEEIPKQEPDQWAIDQFNIAFAAGDNETLQKLQNIYNLNDSHVIKK